MKSRTALIALLGLGLFACASARREMKQYGSTSSYGSTNTYTGPNTIVVSGVIPPVQMGGGPTYTTSTVTNTYCPPELTEVDPVQVITPCDIQYQAATAKCTPKNVEDQFQNVWGGGKLHPDDVTNINYHVGQYIDGTLATQQGVPSSVSTNCFKKPAATYPAGYAMPAAGGYTKPAAGGYTKPAAGSYTAPKPSPVYAAAKPAAGYTAPKASPVYTAPKPVADPYKPAATTAGYKAPAAATQLFLDPVMVYGDVPVPACFSPGYVPQYSPPPYYAPPPKCPNAYGDPLTGNYGSAGAFTGVVINKPGGNYASPPPSSPACYVTAEWATTGSYSQPASNLP